MKQRQTYHFLLLLFVLSGCTQDQTEQTVNDALLANSTEKVDTLLVQEDRPEVLSQADITLYQEIVEARPGKKSFDALTLPQWTGYYSGYGDNKVDFPCLVYNPTTNLFFVSSKRTQAEFERLTDAFSAFKNELRLSGFMDTIKTESQEASAQRDQTEFEAITQQQRYELDNVSPLNAFVYFSGIGNETVDFPLLFASSDLEGRCQLTALGKNGLNRILVTIRYEEIFETYRAYIENRQLVAE